MTAKSATHKILDELAPRLEEARDEMQAEYDEMSEKVQEGEKGEALMLKIDAVQSVLDAIDQAIGELG